MTPKEVFKSAGIKQSSFHAKSDEDSEKIDRVINSLKTLGFKIIKDPDGNEYQYKAIKGHETVVFNHRFGNTGRPAIWIQEGKKVKTKQQLLEDKLRPMVRKILKEDIPSRRVPLYKIYHRTKGSGSSWAYEGYFDKSIAQKVMKVLNSFKEYSQYGEETEYYIQEDFTYVRDVNK